VRLIKRKQSTENKLNDRSEKLDRKMVIRARGKKAKKTEKA